jgi:hypothetical protein
MRTHKTTCAHYIQNLQTFFDSKNLKDFFMQGEFLSAVKTALLLIFIKKCQFKIL